MYGISHYGDNIQDEWCIVGILYELTRRIPGLIVRVEDSDGEFLLIEAANHLPEWANPDKCSGKVFIMNGKLRLIDLNRDLTISQAVLELGSNPNHFQVQPEVEQCVQERIKDFPGNIRSSQHRANVYVPLDVARLLKQRPNLVAACAQAFCNRDPVDLKVIRAMRFFPPEHRVYSSVLFTKCLYAMLVHQNYVPDRRTGWQIPPKTHPDHLEHSMGMKLACGFEILVSEAQKSKKFDEMDKTWTKYLKALKEKGYFREFIEGSNGYNKLKDSAKEYYLLNEFDLKWNNNIGQYILDELKGGNLSSAGDFSSDKADLPPPDSDSWLSITAEDLDKMLNDRYNNNNLDDLDLETGEDGENLTKKLQDFLKLKSDFEGIELDKPPKPQNGESSAKKPSSNTVDFDPDMFQNHVKNLLDFVVPEDNWHSEDSGDMSDYDEDDDDRNNIDSNMSKIRLKTYMNAMDKELKETTIGQSFVPPTNSSAEFDDIEDFQPVDIKMNTLKNMVESYQSQLGGPGPASNLLNSIGLKMKTNNHEESSE